LNTHDVFMSDKMLMGEKVRIRVVPTLKTRMEVLYTLIAQSPFYQSRRLSSFTKIVRIARINRRSRIVTSTFSLVAWYTLASLPVDTHLKRVSTVIRVKG
jgi:hypothetical protein